MFNHILVPLDGSRLAEAALPVAVTLSQKLGARVTLLHAIEKDAPEVVHGQRHLRTVEEATDYLRSVAKKRFPEGTAIDFHVHAAEVGNVAESIIAHAEELNYDLVVMCTHGRGKALHMILGSIAERIISKGSLPVCVTKPAQEGAQPSFSCGALLAPLDGEIDHEHALESAREISRACGAVLHLAMVIPGMADLSGDRAAASRFLPGATSMMLEMSVQDGENYLEAVAKAIRVDGIRVETHVLRGDPATTIADGARRLGAAIIILGTHGKSGMEAFWAGSVAHRVNSQSSVPLLLIPLKKRL